MALITETGRVLHEPYVTTKHGKLRSKRKSRNQPIAATDDLATLENLEEVGEKVELGRKGEWWDSGRFCLRSIC